MTLKIRKEGNFIMKKLFSLALTLSMLFALPALAEDLTGCPLADGIVSAPNYVDITAPMSGTLTAFDLTAGDTVQAGDELMGFVTTGIYATEDAVVKALFVQEGDDAAAATSRYGAVMGLEPKMDQQIQATIAGAYNDEDNRTIHLGETLYFKSSKSARTEGYGRVVGLSGDSYVLDVLKGDFELKENVTLYRTDDYEQKDCVGKGTVVRRDSLLVQGSGRVAGLYVQEGDEVKNGQLLMELVSADAAPDAADPRVESPVNGVVSTVSVNAGQQVWKGQHLCRIYLTDTLEIVAEVDEMDLGDLKVGDTLPVTLDVNKEQVLAGTVTEISALGVTKQNASYYTIHVSIPAGTGRLGNSASVYLK